MSNRVNKPKVLIVDDEPRLARSLESLTRAMGFSPQGVHSGYDAQKLLVIEDFDLIVTDLLMPGISGFDLIDFIRHRGSNTPIVVLTGEGTVDAAVRALKQGAYDFVVKPFEPERFRAILLHGLEKSMFEKMQKEQSLHAERLQDEVREAKYYLEMVLQGAEDVAIITTNREGRIKTFNSGAEKLLGTTAEQTLGRPLASCFLNPRLAEASNELLGGKREKPWREELQIANAHGQNIWMHVVMRRMDSPSPSRAGLILVVSDITSRILLQEKLKILSITDDLTGLYNQRYFYEALQREMERAKRRQFPFSLALFDIDRFKRYNDDFGHLKGDEILKTIGSIVQSTIRKVDYGFRYGGDEFAILLPETEIENAALIAERLRTNVEIEFDGKVTLSIGVVQCGPECEGRLLIEAADRAMYESKRAGGNHVISLGKNLSMMNPQAQ